MKKIIKRKHILFFVLIVLAFFIYNAVYFDIPVEDLKKEYTSAASKFVEIDGMQVHYSDEGKGVPIVLIHGTGASLHTWNDWTVKLKENYRVIRMDLPAFGLTGPNKNGNYTIKNYTKFLRDFLIKINVTNFYLVGNSLGGNIAWNYTADYPNSVKKLILIDASGLPTNKKQPWIFKMAKTPIINSLFLYLTPRSIIKDNIEQVYQDDSKITENLITRYHKMTLRTGNRKAFIDRAKIDFNLKAEENLNKLKSIETKTLILWGENDSWIPLNNGKRMDSLMQNSELRVLKNVGHVPMEEKPIESYNIVVQFLKPNF